MTDNTRELEEALERAIKRLETDPNSVEELAGTLLEKEQQYIKEHKEQQNIDWDTRYDI